MLRTKIKSTIYNLGNNSKCTQGRDSFIGVLFQTRNCTDRQTDSLITTCVPLEA